MSYTLREFIVCVPADSNITIVDYYTDNMLENNVTANKILEKLKNKSGNDYSKKSQICGIDIKNNGFLVEIVADSNYL